MSDQNISATPYPFYATGGDDDSVQHAVLTSHAGASVERNQDSNFSALRSQLVNRDVKDNARETVQAKFDLVVHAKDAEIRASERFAELKSELAAMRAENQADKIAALRQDKTDGLLAQILAKLPDAK